jgi:hypothetical protein
MINLSTTSLMVLTLGLALGSFHFPSLKLGQVVASRVTNRGQWIYMFITMAVWLMTMALVFEAASLLDVGGLSFQSRRRNVLFLVIGFLIGMYIGRLALRHFQRTSEELQ